RNGTGIVPPCVASRGARWPLSMGNCLPRRSNCRPPSPRPSTGAPVRNASAASEKASSCTTFPAGSPDAAGRRARFPGTPRLLGPLELAAAELLIQLLRHEGGRRGGGPRLAVLVERRQGDEHGAFAHGADGQLRVRAPVADRVGGGRRRVEAACDRRGQRRQQ